MLTFNNVLEEATEVFKDVLDNESIELKPETTADDIEEWDSLSHIQLIVALEKHFKIKFTTAEITSYKNVGQLTDGIVHKLNKVASDIRHT
jgi:acyl carrier protein